MMTTTLRHASRAALVCALCGPVAAQDLALPAGAVLTREDVRNPGAYALPTGPWSEDTGLPFLRIEGAVQSQAWRIDGSGLTPLQLLSPLRDQLAAQGYETVFDCIDAACGGFDFRFATRVLPAPAMYVDLTDYQFLSARAPGGGAVSLLTSRDRNGGYVQIIRAGGGATGGTQASAPAIARRVNVAPGSIGAALEADGHAILSDMAFQTGSSSLGDGAVASLDAIAAYLKANPTRRILFVGHTDAVGSLEGNQALSRRRAQSAVDYLRQRHDIPANRIGADGVGFLAPIASNLTPAGRDANRRVEAVLISTE